MSRSSALILIGVLASAPAAADKAVAEAAYAHAQELAKNGNYMDACPLYEASYRAEPAIGVLLHLADCHEHLGLFATAAAEFRDAADLAQKSGDPREARARSHADELAAKAPKVKIVAAAVPGLVVRLDGADVTLLLGTELPTDPGDHELVATAPGRIDWKQKVTIGPAPVATPIEVPELAEPPKPAPVEKPPAPPVAVTTQPPPRPEPVKIVPPEPRPAAPAATPTLAARSEPVAQWSGLKTAGIVAVIGAGVGAAIASYYALHARGEWNDAQVHCSATTCDDTGLTLVQSAGSDADVATATFIVSGVAAAAGAYMLYVAPPDRIEVTPTASAHGGGLVLSGRF